MNDAVAGTAITIDDLQRKALHIRDLAESEVRAVTENRGAQIVAIGAVAIIAAISIAYYLGSRHRQ